MELIPFNKPYITGKELGYISQANLGHMLSGDGPFTNLCEGWLEKKTSSPKVLLTHSCTAALEMSALLLDILPGDEVIMPSFTFVSTANAFVLRGGVPVFIDIREDTLNLDERLIEEAITPRTKAIVVVHYAGVACEMDTIMQIALRHRLKVVEDAAQAIMSTYKGRALGSIGNIGAYSFHETKNIISGEGGAILVNDSKLISRAEIIREKGTDRSRFFRGEVDKYSWQEVGSSFLPGELIAAFLWAQLEEAQRITNLRMLIWQNYHKLFESLEIKGLIRRPIIPKECEHNAHMYYILLSTRFDRQKLLNELKANKISPLFHYVPLHSSTGGKKYGRVHGSMDFTNRQSDCLIRLPMWIGLNPQDQERVVGKLTASLSTSFTSK